MKSLILSAILGAAFANPLHQKRQDLPIEQYNQLPDLPAVGAPVGFASASADPAPNLSVVASLAVAAAIKTDEAVAIAVAKRNAMPEAPPAPSCVSVSFNGPAVTVPTDSPEAFLSNSAFASAATAAAIPSGYARVPQFLNLKASVEDSHYLTYTTDDITSYDPSICAAKCNAMSGCASFNIFYERVPLIVNPATSVPDDSLCPASASSPSATLLKCSFFGTFVKASAATNVGQYWGTFAYVIAGSNAYVKTSAPTLSGFEGPVSFGNAAINAPAPVNQHGYLRVQTFGQNVAFDPSLCAASCAAQTAYNAAHNTGGPCIFFNVYVFDKNAADGVLTCTYFSTPYGTSYATNTGQYDQAGNHYGVTNSYGYYVNGNFVA